MVLCSKVLLAFLHQTLTHYNQATLRSSPAMEVIGGDCQELVMGHVLPFLYFNREELLSLVLENEFKKMTLLEKSHINR